MRAYLLHSAILAVLAVPGGILLVQSYGTGHSGGLFSADSFIKVYWLVYGLYVLFSTLIIFAMHLIMRLQKKKLKNGLVVLAHVVPVGVLWIGVQLGIHDLIDDRMKAAKSLDKEESANTQKTILQKPRPVSSPTLKKNRYRQPGESVPLKSNSQESDK